MGPSHNLSRRNFIVRSGAAVAGGALLSACGPLSDFISGTSGEDAPALTKARTTRSFNPIPAENRKKGSTAWKQSGPQDGSIAGFADKITLAQGETLDLYVSSDGPFRAEIYRMGYYGGAGGRLVHVEDDVKGRSQEIPKPTKYHDLMVEADWKPSVRIATSKRWTTGVYLAKLRSQRGAENYVPFIVRDDRACAMFYGLPVTTWLAYNVWGGRGIYKCISGKGAGDWDARSRLVSFDRPLAQLDKDEQSGADRFFNFDYSMIRFLERNGMDVTYGTSIDVHARPQLLMQHDMYLTAGHDEYWTKEMYDHLEMARDGGVNLAFLGANDGYRGVRLENSPLGKFRRMRHYKEYTEDPLLGKDDDRVAGQWRYGPTNRPENQLIGIMYEANPVDDPWVATKTDHWLFQGTGISKGYSVDHMVGHEFDRVDKGDFAEFTPKGLEVLSRSPVKVMDEVNGGVLEKDEAHSAMYIADSGAGVFAAGTIRWAWFLDDFGGHYDGTEVRGAADKKVQKLTQHLFTAMGSGPLRDYVEKV